MASRLETEIETAGEGPRRVSGDAGSVEQHPLADLIEADRYLKSIDAVNSPKRGFTIAKFKPNGAI